MSNRAGHGAAQARRGNCRLFWLLAALVLCAPATAAAAGAAFEAEIEAVGYVARSGSMVEVSDGSACGAVALEAPSVPNAVAYTISFMEDGDRYVWLRLSQPPNTQRSIWVTMDSTTPPTFLDPDERFDVVRGGSTGYLWDRVTLRGNGSPSAPAEDPRVFPVTVGNHTLAFGLPDPDVRIDRFAITTAINYVPSACDAYVEPPPLDDGGPIVGGDPGISGGDGPFRGAVAAECEPGSYWDLLAEACLTPKPAGGCAGAETPWAVLGALFLIARRRKERTAACRRDVSTR